MTKSASILARWEHGSEFHLPDLSASPSNNEWLRDFVYMGSGRDSLALLIAYGIEHRGWKRVFLPTYYCEDVAPRLRGNGVEVLWYSAGPSREAEVPEGSPGDVLVRVAYFGWGLATLAESFGGEIVEDHTHDPWGAEESEADYCFASLRKTLPLPDGGILWSPRSHSLPATPQLDSAHTVAAMNKLAAMALKRSYLSGGDVDKFAFRALAVEGEAALGRGAISGILPLSQIMLEAMPINAWRRKRRENVEAFRDALGEGTGIEVVGPPDAEAPFAVILRLPNRHLRDALRTRLCNDSIYPAVLWPFDPERRQSLPPEDLSFSDTTMALHADARYGQDDMRRVAQHVRRHATQLNL